MKTAEIIKANVPDFGKNEYSHGYAKCSFDGMIDQTMKFVEKEQLLDVALWKRFVEQFALESDSNDAGWRSEYWGKMMRGACFVYSYTQNEQLYHVLKQTVCELMEKQDEYGRITSYSLEKEFIGWDMWGRKYVLLGLQYFLEISKDEELNDRILQCMCSQMDYIMSKIGAKQDGKKPITDATNHWRGLNSVSILEPVVRLYNLTKEKKYLDFAEYIVGTGGTSVANIFKLAYENDFYPYQYPITKAYEMISCFEGVLEYYRVTGDEWCKISLVNFADRILESDFTVIGCSGCSMELFDHSTVRQANTTNDKIMQETCVTVTLMKFFYQMTLLTGKASYADAFERSFYNAYLGAVNTEGAIEPTIRELLPGYIVEPLPFDSYSPLTAGTRGNGIGGLKRLPDMHYYGCCACIGAMGIGLVPKFGFMKSEDGIVLNLYANGKIKLDGTELSMQTAYPAEGEVVLGIHTTMPKMFSVRLRNPAWSRKTIIKIGNKKFEALIKDGKLYSVSALGECNIRIQNGYIELRACWSDDKIQIKFDMSTEMIRPIPYGQEILMNKVIWGQNYVVSTFDREDPLARKHVSLRRGPLVLAIDSRLGYQCEDVFAIATESDDTVNVISPKEKKAPYNNMVELEVPRKDGTYFRVTDYASAGKQWTKESTIAAWIRVEE